MPIPRTLVPASGSGLILHFDRRDLHSQTHPGENTTAINYANLCSSARDFNKFSSLTMSTTAAVERWGFVAEIADIYLFSCIKYVTAPALCRLSILGSRKLDLLLV